MIRRPPRSTLVPYTTLCRSASVKVASILSLIGTAVAPLAGSVEVTMGGVVSGAAPVVKLQKKLLANGIPARSFTPVVTFAVYVVLGSSVADGGNVAVGPV